MILGIGIDLCKISRINSTLYKFGDRFKKRCFTYNEINKCDRVKNSSACYAKRFASKEAVSKAIGTGITKLTRFKDIEILRDEKGKPILNAVDGFKKYMGDLGITKTHVSLSDERNYAIAFAVLET